MNWTEEQLHDPKMALAIFDEAGKQISELESRIAELEKAINTFCDKSDWAADAWKAQPHIAALFSLCTKKG